MCTYTIILLQSYRGLSDFTFRFECSGEEIPESDAIAQGLMTANMVRRHKASNYDRRWFKVKPGDTIRLVKRDDTEDRDVTYLVPKFFVNPPQNPDMYWSWSDIELYLDTHCVVQYENVEVF